MQEHIRLRLQRLAARHTARSGGPHAVDEDEFLREFDGLRERLLRPSMEEFAAELRRSGQEARVVLDEGAARPSIELALGPRPAGHSPQTPGRRDAVGFAVIRWTGQPLQILAYLEVNPPPFDIERFARAADVAPARVEQLLIDAVEHILSCAAP